MKSALEGILSTLAYHDCFDVPLTPQEIFFSLPATDGTRPMFEEVELALDHALARGLVASSEGFYCLPGRTTTVPVRKSRYALAEGKYARVRKFLRLARHAPYLRAVFVCNTLARSNARSESDIDLYLVASPKRIWLTRLFVTGLATLLRVRPTETELADRICLSFFVTSDALNLRSLAIEDDVYLAHWLHELYPVYDEAGIARRAYVENDWLRDVLPGTRLQEPSQRRALPLSWCAGKSFVERVLDAVFGDRLERWAKRRQLAWLPSGLRAAASASSSDVVLSDTVLKFHDHDRRAEIRDSYREKKTYALRSLA
jgi:hypothetical protein